MHFTVDATDENAAEFLKCIERAIGRQLAGINVKKVARSSKGRRN
jgi:hypothetical protein